MEILFLTQLIIHFFTTVNIYVDINRFKEIKKIRENNKILSLVTQNQDTNICNTNLYKQTIY